MAPPVLKIDNPNIMEHPQLHTPIVAFGQNPQWSTVGDLHGNAMYFIYFAVQRGAMKVSYEDYQNLAVIYNEWSDVKTPEDRLAAKSRFRALIQRIEVAPGAKIRLIGDELADRGMGDDLTLEALENFSDKGGMYETLLSNHAIEFIKHIEKAISQATSNKVLNLELFKTAMLAPVTANIHGPAFYASLINLQHALQSGAYSAEDLLSHYDKHKKTYKAFSYDYGTDGQIILYSHAAVSKNMILSVSGEMLLNFTETEKASYNKVLANQDRTDEDMVPVIDAINRIISKAASIDWLSCLFAPRNNQPTALFKSVWNREDPQDYTHNVHGHDKTKHGTTRESLDGDTGKARSVASSLTYTTSWPYETDVANMNNFELPLLEAETDLQSNSQYRWCININGSRIVKNTSILKIENEKKALYESEGIATLNGTCQKCMDDPWHPDSATLLYMFTSKRLVFARSALRWLLTCLNVLVDPLGQCWQQHTAWRILTSPVRIVCAAIKFPVMVVCGGLGLLLGMCVYPFAPSNNAWAPLVAGFSDGIRPFAPNAARWVDGQNLQYQSMALNLVSKQEKNKIIEQTDAAWSSVYVGSLFLSVLVVGALAAVSYFSGEGLGLGKVMPFIFKDVLDMGGLLTPVLQPLSQAFGVVWPYLAGSMFVGGMTAFFNEFVPKHATPVIPNSVIPNSVIPKPQPREAYKHFETSTWFISKGRSPAPPPLLCHTMLQINSQATHLFSL